MTVRALPAHAVVVVVVAAAAIAVGAGAGCGLPFDVSRDVGVVLPLGVVDAGCTNASSSQRLGGRDVTFDRHAQGDACVASSTATGAFLDLAAAKRHAGPDAHGTHVDGVTIDVLRSRLRFVDPGRVRSLHVVIDVGGAQDVVVTDGVPPRTSAHVSDAVVRALDDAWQRGADVDGTGIADVVLDAGVAASPDVAIDLKIHVEGRKTLGE